MDDVHAYTVGERQNYRMQWVSLVIPSCREWLVVQMSFVVSVKLKITG